jgi:hypothetical protein
MFDFDDIGWGDSIKDSMDKRPHPPQGGSGVPKEKTIKLSFDLGLGYMPFETASAAIDKIIEKYGDTCVLYISATINTNKEND